MLACILVDKGKKYAIIKDNSNIQKNVHVVISSNK